MNAISKTILVVDDEEGIREILTAIFERKGYKVLSASNGKEGFELVKSGNNIDLVISDIQMPGGNGIEFLDRVKDNNYEVPIVLFITGFADISLEDAYDKGAEAVFAKPFNQKQLLSVVERALTPKEERWAPRSDRLPSNITIRLKFPGFGTSRSAKVMNLGRGGIFVALEEGFPKINDSVSFKIEFTDDLTTVIEGSGIVRWVRIVKNQDGPEGCGIEFADLNNQVRLKIIELINFLKTRQYIPKN